jgi:hypothetical protein
MFPLPHSRVGLANERGGGGEAEVKGVHKVTCTTRCFPDMVSGQPASMGVGKRHALRKHFQHAGRDGMALTFGDGPKKAITRGWVCRRRLKPRYPTAPVRLRLVRGSWDILQP